MRRKLQCMTRDYFALFGLKRHPVVDQADLKDRFMTLSREVHPDQHGADASVDKDSSHPSFEEVNAAYQCLRDTKQRLEHLLELELGTKPASIQTIPNDLAKVGAEVMMFCREVDAFLRTKTPNPSPMIRSQDFRAGLEWAAKGDSLSAQLSQVEAELELSLRELGQKWPSAASHPSNRSSLMEDLDRAFRKASYHRKWCKLIKERQFQLAL